MASEELKPACRKVVGYPPLSEMGDLQRREFHEALLDADSSEDLPGKRQAAILKAEQSRPKLARTGERSFGHLRCKRGGAWRRVCVEAGLEVLIAKALRTPPTP